MATLIWPCLAQTSTAASGARRQVRFGKGTGAAAKATGGAHDWLDLKGPRKLILFQLYGVMDGGRFLHGSIQDIQVSKQLLALAGKLDPGRFHECCSNRPGDVVRATYERRLVLPAVLSLWETYHPAVDVPGGCLGVCSLFGLLAGLYALNGKTRLANKND